MVAGLSNFRFCSTCMHDHLGYRCTEVRCGCTWADKQEPSRAGRVGDSQPMPTPNDTSDVQAAVIADIERRREVGIARYGTPLQPHNGRNALLDLYEELLDAAMYVKQRLIEEGA